MSHPAQWSWVAWLVLVAAPAAAQPPKPVSAVSGTVTDGTRPLAEATVEVFGTKLTQVTGPNGAFRFDSLKPGPYWLRVRRIGFAPITFTTTLRTDDTRDLQIQLEATPYQLPELQVQGGMTKWLYNEFRWRKAGAWGKFFTRDDIAQLRPYDLVALVQRGLPRLTRSDIEAVNWDTPAFNPYGAAGWASGPAGLCPPQISFNGGTPWPGRSLTDFQLDEVEAVEVYGSRHLPIEFQNPGFGSGGSCGLVVVWVR